MSEHKKHDKYDMIDRAITRIATVHRSGELLVCEECGERIHGDDFICIPDLDNESQYHFFYATGKCSPLHGGKKPSNIPLEQWYKKLYQKSDDE